MVQIRRSVTAVLLAAVLVGCAEQGGSVETPPSGEPGASSSGPAEPQPPVGRESARPEPTPVVPTLEPPSRPPRKPTDPKPGDRLAGRVTKGGSGPCYGLVTDDGTQYALHSSAGITLEEGTYVRVVVEPLKLKIYCGPGQHMALLSATKV